MAPALKLTYFDIAGRAEAIRLTLVAGGVEFEDQRLAFADAKPEMEAAPFGALPVLEIDGKKVAQSMGLLRYAGKLAGLYSEDPVVAVQIDQIVECFASDIQGPLNGTFQLEAEEKLKARKKIAEKILPRYLSGLEKLISPSSSEYLVDSKLSIADILLYTVFNAMRSGMLDGIPTDCCSSTLYPRLNQSYEKTAALPAIAKFTDLHKKK